MNLIVYVDVVFIENFIVDYFLLNITGKIVKKDMKKKLSIIASVIGGIYSITFLCFKTNYIENIFIEIFIAIAMTSLAFKQKKILSELKMVITFLSVSFLLAGVCFYIQSQTLIFNYKKLLLSIIIIYILIDKVISMVYKKKELYEFIYKVEIINQGIVREVTAFFDTGNELREPATGLPVIIVESNIFNALAVKNKDFYKIPYRLIDGNIGQLQGFKPEYVLIRTGNKTQKKKVIVACCNYMLSTMNEYNALLSRGII